MAKRITLAVVTVFLVVAGLLPILATFLKSVMVNGHLSLASYQGLLTSRHEWTLMGHSLALSTLTTLLTIAIGLPLGVLLAKTDLPLRRLFLVLFTIPLLVPPYITAVSWFGLLGPDGLLARVLDPAVAKVTSGWLFGLPGCVLVLSSTFLPIVMLLTMTYLKTVNPRLEEAGQLMTRWFGVLKGITIPLILPGVLLAAMLVFLLSFGEFGVPTFLRYDVFPLESFTQFSAFYNFGAATATAIPLAVITFLVLGAERIFLREKTYQLQAAPHGERSPLVALGPLRRGLFALVGLLCFIVVVGPLLVLLIQSASLSAYAEALNQAGGSLLRSLTYGIVGATLLTAIGFLSGYLIHTRALPFWRSVDSLTVFLFALPSTVTGIGLISLWNRPGTNFIYGTAAIIVLGYLAKYTALTSRITVSTLAQIPPSMEEAAQVVGARWVRRMGGIVAPLAKRGLVAGWLVGYIFCLRDMGITMMVYPAGHETFPVRIFTLMANGSPELISALCLIMIAATLLPLGVGWVTFRMAAGQAA
ncbi:MAG: ABC transporter permease [Candidatus Binatia bacterium]